MRAKGNIIIKYATKEKAELVDQNMDAILSVEEGTTTVAGLIIKRLRNKFIII